MLYEVIELLRKEKAVGDVNEYNTLWNNIVDHIILHCFEAAQLRDSMFRQKEET